MDRIMNERLLVNPTRWETIDATETEKRLSRRSSLASACLLLSTAIAIILAITALVLANKYEQDAARGPVSLSLIDTANLINLFGGLAVTIGLLTLVSLSLWSRILYLTTKRLWLGHRDWSMKWAAGSWYYPFGVQLLGGSAAALLALLGYVIPWEPLSDFLKIAAVIVGVGTGIVLLIALARPASVLREIDRMLRGNVITFPNGGPRLADGWRANRASRLIVVWFVLFYMGTALISPNIRSLSDPTRFESVDDGIAVFRQTAAFVVIGSAVMSVACLTGVAHIRRTSNLVKKHVFLHLSESDSRGL